MEQNNFKMDGKIKCGKCNKDSFELRLVIVGDTKSIIAHCSCGRVIEYRGVTEAKRG